MSRGLGKIQRLILEALEETESVTKEVFGFTLPVYHREITHLGQRFNLKDGIYDLRQVCRYLAGREDKLYDFGAIKESFHVSFYRAVRGLIKRGYLEQKELGGIYGRQLRFVSVTDMYVTLRPEEPETEPEPEPIEMTEVERKKQKLLNMSGNDRYEFILINQMTPEEAAELLYS
jgi:hypothetical protein